LGAARSPGSSSSKNSRGVKPIPRARKISGEGGQPGVVVADRGVVVAPGELEFGLDVRELALELAEVGAGLQLRVVLGHGQEPAQGRAEGALGPGLLGRLARGQSLAAQGRDPGEELFFVAGVALDRLDQVRHQVRAAFQLHVDAAFALFGHVAQPDQAIVNGHGPDDDEDDEAKKGEKRGHGQLLGMTAGRPGGVTSKKHKARKTAMRRGIGVS